MEKATFTDADYPIATRSLLADHELLENSHGKENVNQPLFALIRARKAISDARLCCRYARALNKDKEAVVARLDELAKELSDMEPRFPLMIMENGGGKKRPPIMSNSLT